MFQKEQSFSNFDCSAGGHIWIKWNSEKLIFSPILKEPQLIHGKVLVPGNHSFFLTCIYADNEAKVRTRLWNKLKDIAAIISGPWSIMGDFNCPLFSKDKIGGNPISLNNSIEFKDCINDCELLELPSSGLYYT